MKRDWPIILGAVLMFGLFVAYEVETKEPEKEGLAEGQARVTPLDPMQANCLVCEEPVPRSRDISYTFPTEDGKKLVFFDKEECREKFAEDREKYLEDYVPTTERSQPGGPPGMMGPGGGGPGGPGRGGPPQGGGGRTGGPRRSGPPTQGGAPEGE